MSSDIQGVSRGFDPRTKLLWTVALGAFAIAFRDWIPLAALCAITIVVATICGVRWRQVARKSKRFLQLLVLIVLVQVVFVRTGVPLISISGLGIVTSDGLSAGCEFALRYSTIIMAGFIMTTSTMRESIQGLIQLRVPYLLVFMVMIAIRFIPELGSAYRDCLTALQLRGVDIRHIPFRKKVSVYGYIIVPVVAYAITAAQNMAVTMEARGFGAYKQRTSLHTLVLSAKDYAMALACFIAAGSAVAFMICG